MINDVFLDTSYAIAIASKNDSLHERAKELAATVKRENLSAITTQAVLLEIGNALSRNKQRETRIHLLENLENDPNTAIIALTDDLYDKGFDLFRDRTDKEWGLVDNA